MPAFEEPAAPAAASAEAPILSTVAVEASRHALASLSKMVVKPEVAGSDTLEGVVRDMLKPMLKDWLDANLPEIVERMVAQEVARISGRSV
jgi:cell pole-organizing protein PopZ